MSRYGQALGIAEFEIQGVDIEIKPKHGDNRKLMKIQQRANDNTEKMIEEFIPFAVELLNRNEQFSADSEEYKELELFCELHVMSLLREIMIAFNWTTNEKWEEQESKQTKGFPEANVS